MRALVNLFTAIAVQHYHCHVVTSVFTEATRNDLAVGRPHRSTYVAPKVLWVLSCREDPFARAVGICDREETLFLFGDTSDKGEPSAVGGEGDRSLDVVN